MLNALMASACSTSLGGAGAGIAEHLAGCGPAGGQKQQRGVLHWLIFVWWKEHGCVGEARSTS